MKTQNQTKAYNHMLAIGIGFLTALALFALFNIYWYRTHKQDYGFENHSEIQARDVYMAQQDSIVESINSQIKK